MNQGGASSRGDQCIFCQLTGNPEQIIEVGQTENFYAWLDINPRATGYTMVVPKKHVESVLDLEPEEYNEMMKLVREVVVKAEEGLDADGVTVALHEGETGGQMMDHAYVQVIPRFDDEENAGTPVTAMFPQKEDIADEESLREIQGRMNSVEVNFEEAIEPHPQSRVHAETEEEEMGEEQEGEETEDESEYKGGSVEWG